MTFTFSYDMRSVVIVSANMCVCVVIDLEEEAGAPWYPCQDSWQGGACPVPGRQVLLAGGTCHALARVELHTHVSCDCLLCTRVKGVSFSS